ncbi:hypothetical protein CRENBAI_020206 [Crenichthys baileyi]|uniref:Uncharacterized protein n=1 Tax=Crenichthys baileyi TaxID=28760 RepID=A0AAV9SHW9_9TELE
MGVHSALLSFHRRISKQTLTVGVSGIPGPLFTEETKHCAASLYRIKQSLNVSSCYPLPVETSMKGPLMRFQKHLVIGLRATEWRGVGKRMSRFLELQVHSLSACVPMIL